jgi:hypothetical protein
MVSVQKAQKIHRKLEKKRLKDDYKFKMALLSADPETIKTYLRKKGIPHSSDDVELMEIARWLTSCIRNHRTEVVQSALEKYDECLRKE